jgi:hypothetical protein
VPVIDNLRVSEDRGPSPWPPRLLVIAILVLAGVAIVRHLPPAPVAPPHRPAAAESTGPVQLAGLGSGAAHLLDHSQGIGAPPAPVRRQFSAGCRRLKTQTAPHQLPTTPCKPHDEGKAQSGTRGHLPLRPRLSGQLGRLYRPGRRMRGHLSAGRTGQCWDKPCPGQPQNRRS